MERDTIDELLAPDKTSTNVLKITGINLNYNFLLTLSEVRVVLLASRVQDCQIWKERTVSGPSSITKAWGATRGIERDL